MNALFNLCVYILQVMANLTGMTYQAINIWIFVILEPIAFVLMAWVIWRQRRQIQKLRQAMRQPA